MTGPLSGQQAPDVPCDLARRMLQLQVGDRHAAPAGRLEHAALLAVALEGGACAVDLPAVDLDDHALSSPDAVDLEALHVNVGLRTLEARAVGERNEELLEVALGEGRAPRCVCGAPSSRPWCPDVLGSD